MLLKSLKMKDFRQFKGVQDITFADDIEKNVTVIMGDNGTGKTTLAQAFTWCLYGTTNFEDDILLCKATSADMMPGSEEKVRVEIVLIHKGVEYTVISEQTYKKDQSGTIKSQGQRQYVISFKQNGQTEFIKETQRYGKMQEILPKELARYFFFDGEHITTMSKRLSQGKGDEFSRAVRSLLGLDALLSSIDHLKKVVRNYDKRYDGNSDSRISEYNRQIVNFENEIERIDNKLDELSNEETPVDDRIAELQGLIEKNKLSEHLARQKGHLLSQRQSLISQKSRNITELLKVFRNAPAFFSLKLMHDSLQKLKETRKSEKSIPSVNAKTINFLLDRGKCICGTEVCTGNEAFIELTNLLSYVPPKSIGDSIADFREKCTQKVRDVDTLFDDFSDKYAEICGFSDSYQEVSEDITNVEKQLLGLKDVGELQRELMKYQNHKKAILSEKDELNRRKGSIETNKNRVKTERETLTLKDDANRRIMIYQAYAKYMLDTITTQYTDEERKIRKELEQTVNKIFHNILGEGFSLSLSEKYDVQVVLNSIGGSSETSTAQNISIIFAFIAGVIEMARNSQKEEGGLLVAEPYPLVMDAPLSAFDKKRIQNVCDVLPKIAEQVIIFIKDADGEIAQEHLGSRIGKQLTFTAKDESKIETYIS